MKIRIALEAIVGLFALILAISYGVKEQWLLVGPYTIIFLSSLELIGYKMKE